ncbi:MAG: (2Fe-2S) ferredoxin domain-containing protein, partial [Spirochaetaceae bacterium]|nr:(2Fe-2S) ferredoxin domain-containing protein [Spirochaetaceae bacterium]
VCIGSSCHIKGSYNIIQAFQQLIEERSLHDRIVFKSSFCRQQCRKPGVAVLVDGVSHQVTPDRAGEFFMTEVAPRL